MRPFTIPLLLMGCWFLASPAGAQNFPRPDELPVRRELPDPLVMLDGTPVSTPEQWAKQRRPELKQLFQHYMYGYMPAAPQEVKSNIERVSSDYFGGKATKREVTISFGPDGTPPIHLLVIVPNKKSGPVPVFVGLNFGGNHTVTEDAEVPLPTVWMYPHRKGVVDNRATEEARGSDVDVWCAETLIDRGYALATFYNGDIDPDRPDFTDGVHPHYFQPGQSQPGPRDWGTIAAWAWGLSRAVDYLVSADDIDAQRVCAIGHSRLGKTALLAGAFDERIALVVPHQSGTGGCALSRENDQETIERINRVFPHWFSDTFPQFDGREDRLPIDQHLLIALVAPRPLMDTEGDQDTWANYDNAWKAVQAADRVYKFLGARGLVGNEPLHGDEPITPESCGELVQYRRDSKHELNRDYWLRILDFADARLK
ncbi:MAG: alpha/beta hydrolase family protein [Pirellulales bacterium]